jgi:hypothetical protein
VDFRVSNMTTSETQLRFVCNVECQRCGYRKCICDVQYRRRKHVCDDELKTKKKKNRIWNRSYIHHKYISSIHIYIAGTHTQSVEIIHINYYLSSHNNYLIRSLISSQGLVLKWLLKNLKWASMIWMHPPDCIWEPDKTNSHENLNWNKLIQIEIGILWHQY